MKSSPRLVDLLRDRSEPQWLVSDGGVTVNVRDPREPFAALDDLMVVVEALCPAWPPRDPFGPMPDLRL
jgi:hypothetical protein